MIELTAERVDVPDPEGSDFVEALIWTDEALDSGEAAVVVTFTPQEARRLAAELIVAAKEAEGSHG